MHIKRIEIDGFKSYAQKQVVDQFDSQFNAITGLNGTGKSNILDSICFVLGITNLSCIRAGQMNDLVFKQGQAGINKATVTITFDNRNKNQTPLGYKDYNEIIVRRQVIVNGRNSYTINGTAATNGKVADFFRSVGLNVNNPHFLIMQGRITKVLNMKPHEILGMLEEAAGTKMYDAKRDQAVAVIKKKQCKVDEIDKALNEDILPTVERLKQDRVNYLEWQKHERDIANFDRKLLAYVFYQSKREEENCREGIEKRKVTIEEIDQKTECNNKEIADGDNEYSELEEQKCSQNTGEKSDLEARMKELNNKQAKMESERDAVKDEQKKLTLEINRSRKNLEQDEKHLSSKQKELLSLETDKGGEELKGNEANERVERARAHLSAVMKGMTTDDSGNEVTVEAQINKAKQDLVELSANIKTAQTRDKQLRPQLAEKRKEISNLSRQQTDESKELEALEKEKKKLESQIGKIHFDENYFRDIYQRQGILDQEKNRAETAWNAARSRDMRLNFNYRKNMLPHDFDFSKVIGIAANHFKTIDAKFNTAVEVAGGGQLFQVIVKDSRTSQQLISSNCLEKRTAFIPLDSIRPNVCDKNKLQIAKNIARQRGEECWLALELLEFDKDLSEAMKFIFGNVVICQTKETASMITYDQRCRVRTVSLEGDLFNPSGSGSGGSRDNRGGSLLALTLQIQETGRLYEDKRSEFQRVIAEIDQLKPIREHYLKCKQDLNEASERLEMLQQNVQNSPIQVLKDEISDLEREIPELEAKIRESQAKAKELHDKVRTYEDRKKNAKQFKKQEEDKAKKELNDAEKALSVMKGAFEASKLLLTTLREEIGLAEERISTEEKNISANEDKMKDLGERLKEKEVAVSKAKEEVKIVQEQVEAFRGKMKVHDEHMKKLQKKLDALKKENQVLANKQDDLKKEIVKLKEDGKHYVKQYNDVMKKHVWIKDIEDSIGAAGTDFDFNGFNYEKSKKEVEKMRERKEELGRKLNTKAMNILGTAEENVMNLLKKKEQLEQDKHTILETIAKLDEKKKTEVLKAHEMVTRDFGNIFSTLLPDTSAKLEPPAGKTALDGLEVKVAFNGKWKDSLGELSGGQRSLVALSLVLAMLKFKPAPLYILDEVDAALDLSHTQNIGAMIKKHFTNSQFIIVSLKEGMFNNANVIYRTKFQDGTSQVVRTENR